MPARKATLAAAIAVALLGLAVLAVACSDDNGGGGEEYPDSVIENFMDGCTAQAGADEDACACAIDEIQKILTLEEFTELELRIANTGEVPEELAGPIAKCLT